MSALEEDINVYMHSSKVNADIQSQKLQVFDICLDMYLIATLLSIIERISL